MLSAANKTLERVTLLQREWEGSQFSAWLSQCVLRHPGDSTLSEGSYVPVNPSVLAVLKYL